MLLPEFFYLDQQLVCRPADAVVDNFGVATDIGPSTGQGDPDWAMSSLAPADEQAPRDGGGAFLYVPNISIELLDNDDG